MGTKIGTQCSEAFKNKTGVCNIMWGQCGGAMVDTASQHNLRPAIGILRRLSKNGTNQQHEVLDCPAQFHLTTTKRRPIPPPAAAPSPLPLPSSLRHRTNLRYLMNTGQASPIIYKKETVAYDTFRGPFCCEGDAKCAYRDQYYSQCIPKETNTANNALDGQTDNFRIPDPRSCGAADRRWRRKEGGCQRAAALVGGRRPPRNQEQENHLSLSSVAEVPLLPAVFASRDLLRRTRSQLARGDD